MMRPKLRMTTVLGWHNTMGAADASVDLQAFVIMVEEQNIHLEDVADRLEAQKALDDAKLSQLREEVPCLTPRSVVALTIYPSPLARWQSRAC